MCIRDSNNIGMSNVSIIPFSYIFLRGQGIKIFSLVVNECAQNGFVLPTLEKLEPNQKHYLKNSGILNELKEIDGGVHFRSITTGNYSLKDPAYQSFKIHISSPLDDNLKIFVNKKEYTVSIKDLAINGSQVFSMKGWLSELIKIGPFNHQDELYFSQKIRDSKPIQKTDRYRVEVIQNNGERAWSSPIWVSN